MSLLNSITSKLKFDVLVHPNHKKMKNKKAMFISIELIVVLIVVAALVIFVALMTKQLKLTWTSSGIIREVKNISEGVIKFKLLYGYYPGDIPSNLIPGSELDKGEVKNNIAYYETGLGSSQTSASGGLKKSDFDLYTKSATGIVGGIKSFLAHQQLTASGLFVSKATNTFIPASALLWPPSNVLYNLSGLMSDVLNIHYTFYLDSCANGLNMCDMGPFYLLYNSNLGVYPRKLNGVPRISITRYTGSTLSLQTAYTTLQLYNTPGDGFASSPITSELASAIDNKIDDGMPFGVNSNIFSTDVMYDYNFTASSGAKGLSDNVYPVSNSFVGGVKFVLQENYYGCTNLISPDVGTTVSTGITSGTTKIADLTFKQFQDADYSKITGSLQSGILSTSNCNMLFTINEG